MYYAILPRTTTVMGAMYYQLDELRLNCPDYCETEEQAVTYLTNAGYRRFKLYKQQVEFVAEYAPQEQPVVRKVTSEEKQNA